MDANLKKAAEIEGSAALEKNYINSDHEYTTNKPLVPDLSQAQRFLTLLDEDSERFTFEAIEEPKPKQKTAQIQRYNGTFETYSEVLRKSNLQGYGIFVTINETDGKGRKKEDVKKVYCHQLIETRVCAKLIAVNKEIVWHRIRNQKKSEESLNAGQRVVKKK
ncbi:MAG: hypothetical protein JJU12_05645, partial [Chlamydiales bacterium]|nr:hypothetical protein [Chlamydiales bacterium]